MSHLYGAIRELTAWFESRALEPPVSIRLRSADEGERFVREIAREFQLNAGASDFDEKGFVDIAGVRVIWPTRAAGG